MKRYTLSFIVLVIAIGIPFLLITPNERDVMSGDERVTRELLNNALRKAIQISTENYYKPIEDPNKMYRGAIKGALASLEDDYTYYILKREHQRAVENLYNAEFGGLGVQIYDDHRGFIKISKPIPNTPAALANLQAGDYITKVNGKRIHLSEKTGMTRASVIDLLRGKTGTDVTITVQRKFLEPFEVTLTRAIVPIRSVKSTMLDGNIGYIQISGFIGNKDGTEEEFKNALTAHKAGGMKALILDLRGNQGGLLNAAYHIADAFIDQGLIVSTKSETNSKFDEEYPATHNILCPLDIPLIVLVNEYSASASEIVAGAIKDTRRGILVGQKTYGKGVVQKRYELPDGSSMSLTISTYYTPNGTSINEVGITPQVSIEREEPDEIEHIMLRKLDSTDSVENFVSKWIDDAHQKPGEMPKDFSLLERDLPKLQQTLEAEENITLSLRWLRQRAEQYFNLYVGIDQVVNLAYDQQLKEAIRIIEANEVEKYLNPTPDAAAEPPSTTQANMPPEHETTTEE
ncbi:MAG: S41 family peptidase [Candidatus Poribacteria bacterium]|nr:S41 family peptidase [Candidatus Poribacteria bacterium]